MLQEMEHNEFPTIKRGSHLSKRDISAPTATSGPTFVEGGVEKEVVAIEEPKSPERITPEIMRKRVSGLYSDILDLMSVLCIELLASNLIGLCILH